ncbi:hypothetical protein LN650_08650 [Klebsiella pneumoniae subsp. pneumoniae]|nr:hypothetical protein [Klebsiella pneumoniae subsp. pneumoniae]
MKITLSTQPADGRWGEKATGASITTASLYISTEKDDLGAYPARGAQN